MADKDIIIKRKIKPDYTRVYAVIVFLLLVYFMLRYLNDGLWYSVYSVYYLYLTPILVAFSLYFKRLREPAEVKLLFLYCLWVYITRLLNGDYFLTYDAGVLLDICVDCVFLTVCVGLRARDRQRFLDVISFVVAGYYTLLALAGLYGVILKRELHIPFSWESLVEFEGDMSRLSIFGVHPNICGLWFLISFFLLLYLFLRNRNIIWRIGTVLAAAVNYFAISMTFSRNTELAFSGGAVLLIALGIMKLKPCKRMSSKLLVTLVTVLIAVPLIYLSFTGATGLVRVASEKAVSAVTQEQTEMPGQGSTDSGSTASGDDTAYVDTRGFDDSSRIIIFKSLFTTMQREPIRLLRGSLYQDMMSVAYSVLPVSISHFHNTYLQVLAYTGIVGLLIVLAFCIMLAVKVIKLYFSDGPLSLKVLSMIIAASLSYNILERDLFIITDFRAVIFFVIAGALLAWFRDEAHKTLGEETD